MIVWVASINSNSLKFIFLGHRHFILDATPGSPCDLYSIFNLEINNFQICGFLHLEQSRPATAKNMTSAALARVPISNVTKQSFRKSPVDDAAVGASQVNLPQHQPLLPRRQQQQQQAGE